MKVRTLSVLAGLAAPLIMTAPSDAGFSGAYWTKKDGGLAYGLKVINIYAEFDNPGGDWMQAVAGTPGAPLNITVIGGTFYNNQFGSDQAPGTALIGVFPSLAYDSFFTIGIKALPAGAVNALNLVNMPVLAGTSVSTTNGSWGLVPPTAAQGNPFDPVNSYPGNGSILIGQFAMEIPAETPYGFVGSFLIQYVSDGAVGQSVVSFENIVPTPGALGLLGLAGLVGIRRRRR